MIDFQPRYTSRLVRLCNQLERLEGYNSRFTHGLENDPGVIGETIQAGAEDMHELAAGIDLSGKNIQALIAAHSLTSSELNSLRLLQLFAEITGSPENSDAWRRTPSQFAVSGTPKDELLFETVPPFQTESRLAEILEWTRSELQLGILPPILVISTSCLLLFQCSPFRAANQQIALISAWALLRDSGFHSVTLCHPASIFRAEKPRYIAVLKQAERSALTTWITVTAWSEFFVEAVKQCAVRAADVVEQRTDRERLTPVQRLIVEIVKGEGPISREKIADHTKINLSTVKYNLGVLAARGILQRKGGGRSTAYVTF